MVKKITMVGAGNVGATAVQRIIEKDLAETVVMVDVIDGVPQGKALDMWESAPIEDFDTRVLGGTDFSMMKDSDIVLVTAGLARKPGMSRSDLRDKNAEIVKGIGENIKKHAPKAIVIVVTNPLDVMAYAMWKVTGFEPRRVIGMAGVLDSSRMASFIAEELDVSVENVSAFVLGGHGDSMVPLPRYTTVAGIPIPDLMDKSKIDAIVKRTQNAGAEIVNFLKTGSAYYSPSAALVRMVESIVKNKKMILPSTVYLNGEYGQKDVYAGVPVKLGKNGVESIIQINMTNDERAAFNKSCEDVRADLKGLNI